MFRINVNRSLGSAAGQLGLLVEPVIGGEKRIAIVFIGAAMKLVGPAFGDKGNRAPEPRPPSALGLLVVTRNS